MPPPPLASSGIKLNEVTWYSKLGALVLLLGVVPALCFYIGMQYDRTQQAIVPPMVQVPSSPTPQPPVQPTEEAYTGTSTTLTIAGIDKTLSNCYNSHFTTRDVDECASTALQNYEIIAQVQQNLLKERIENFFIAVSAPPTSTDSTTRYHTDAVRSQVDAEAAWKEYRDSICGLDADFWLDGTGAGGDYLSCQIKLTKVHILDLTEIGSTGS